MMHCLLCRHPHLQSLKHQNWSVGFFLCSRCDFIFRDPASFLSFPEQKQRYDQHNNSPADPRYIQYLNQVILPLQSLLGQGEGLCGVDWGSGPGPALSQQMRLWGCQMQDYDPIYSSRKPSGPVDFVTCTEVIEHFLSPRESFEDIFGILKTRGIFAGMTNFHPGPESFPGWWYAKDPTHVCFFSEKTLREIAFEWRLDVIELRSPVFIFRKN